MCMKRLPALILALCLLFSCALAEDREPLRYMDIDPSGHFRAEGIPAKAVDYNPWTLDLTALMQSKAAPDLLSLHTASYDLSSLANAGLLADLSGYAALREVVSRMNPSAQALVTTEEGQIIGIPVRHYLRPFYWNQDAWDAAGLTEKDVPQSYTELLAFLERWCDRLEENPDQRACVAQLSLWNTGTEKYNYAWWLTEMLLACWETQQWYAGEAISFNDPAFTALAERTRDVALRLYRLEPREKKRQSMPPLFVNALKGGNRDVFERPDSLSHAVPMRITSNQPALFNAQAYVWCIRSGSSWQDEAAGFIQRRYQSHDGTVRAALYADFPAGIYSSINISQSWLDDYRSGEEMVVYPVSVFNQKRNGATGKESLMMKFFKKSISAETFAQRLNALIQ